LIERAKVKSFCETTLVLLEEFWQDSINLLKAISTNSDGFARLIFFLD
jgi:hypothetical protein